MPSATTFAQLADMQAVRDNVALTRVFPLYSDLASAIRSRSRGIPNLYHFPPADGDFRGISSHAQGLGLAVWPNFSFCAPEMYR